MSNLLLDEIKIAKPCQASWADMSGDDRVRFCSHCSLHVYNLSAMSRGQAEDFVAQREGRTCVRLYRRADGTVLTQDCPVGLRAWRKRLAWLGAVAAGLLVAVIGVTAALVAASTAGRNQQDANPTVSLIQRIKDWLFPPPPPPPMPPMPIMGMIVPVERIPIAPPPPDGEPVIAPPP